MRVIAITAAIACFTAMSAASVAAPAPQSAKSALTPATPAGITVQIVSMGGGRGGGGMGGGSTMTVFADAEGKTLYTFDKDTPGISACTGECVALWPPLAAAPNVSAAGDWTVLTRDDGVRQWAHKGKALYTFVKDGAVGEAKGHNAVELWRAAVFKPMEGVLFPEGIAAEEVVNAPGWALVNTRRMTLYTLDGETGGGKTTCAGTCLDTWTPLTAPEIANQVGEFAPLKRSDGLRQWAYRGQPLYLFVGDAEPGDVNGDGKDGKWRAAIMTRYFNPANVTITSSARHGAMLSTDGGLTLYARDANKFTGGAAAHSDRSIARGIPVTGRLIGVRGCEGKCTETWLPFKASAEDRATGYWSIVTRDDGTRQWSYLGYPLYTYVKDVPGAARGHDIYDIDGKIPGVADTPQQAGAQALYWRVALP